MTLITDFTASIFGIGPNYTTKHQDIRDLLNIDDEYTPVFSNILDFYHTFPLIDYGSTIEGDEFTALLFGNETPGSSVADQWYNTLKPNSKKRRNKRHGILAHDDTKVNPLSERNFGPQALYNYYENGSWPGPRLAVMITDTMNSGDPRETITRPTQEIYGTDRKNMRYGFKAKLANWDEKTQEYQDIILTHLYINGKYVPINQKTIAAANLYAEELINMIASKGKQDYNPVKAMQKVISKYGMDAFKANAWKSRRSEKRRLKTQKLAA